MASIKQNPDTGRFQLHFRYKGRQFHKGLRTESETTANAIKATVEETLLDLARGKLTLPDGADDRVLWQFLKSGGKLTELPEVVKSVTLGEVLESWEKGLPEGAMEANSRVTARIHMAHVLRVLGKARNARTLSTKDLQDYVGTRSREEYRKRAISARTIKKELGTLRAVWNTQRAALALPELSFRGLKYEKGSQVEPFRTWEQIEQAIARGGPNDDQQAKLWETLFLDVGRITELLDYVKKHATAPWLYPAVAFIAHTGARRSEMMRSLVEDWDLDAHTVRVREKKKDKSVRVTFRHVPLSDLLTQVITDWLDAHPGGPFAFCQQDGSPLTRDIAHDHFKRTLAGSEWERVRGFHVLRHSFASNLARENQPDRVIDKLMGHQTEDMRRRYQHLFPEAMTNAIARVFGHAS